VQNNLTPLVGAATFCTIAAALDAHVNEARRKGWCLPSQVVAGAYGAQLLFVLQVPASSLAFAENRSAGVQDGETVLTIVTHQLQRPLCCVNPPNL